MSNKIYNNDDEVVSHKEVRKKAMEKNGGTFPLSRPLPEDFLTGAPQIEDYIPGKEGSNTLWPSSFFSRVRLVPIDIVSRTNRVTRDSVLLHLLQDGFDHTKLALVRVAKLPCGTMFLFDGDHTRHLQVIAVPGAKWMLADVVEVESEAEISDRFINLNSREGKTPLSREEIFVHEVLAKRPDAVKYAASITEVGAQVYCSPSENGFVGKQSGPKVKVGALKKTIDLFEDLSHATEAMRLLVEFGGELKKQSQFPNELFEGLTMLLGTFPSLKGNENFEDWFDAQMAAMRPKVFGKHAKEAGGNQVNFHAFSVALGITELIIKDPRYSEGVPLPEIRSCRRKLRRAFGPDRRGPKKGTTATPRI